MNNDKILESFKDFIFDWNCIPIITVYNKNTSDYTGFYIARLYYKNIATNYILKKNKLGHILKEIPNNFQRLERSKYDDDNIICNFL